MKYDFSKTVSLSLFIFVLAGIGCTTQTNVAPTSLSTTTVKPFAIETLNADDIASIKTVIAANTGLVRVASSTAWTIPSGIDPMQIVEGVSSFVDDQTLFAFVSQPNMWNPLWHASGTSLFGSVSDSTWKPVNFAGVLYSRDSGKTWRKLFSIPPVSGQDRKDGELTPFNPVGMFVEKNKLWLDIIDDDGAGSGEGILVRYSSMDGVTWAKEKGCYLFLPESYYDLSHLPATYTHFGVAPIRPHNVKATACPDYISQLPF